MADSPSPKDLVPIRRAAEILNVSIDTVRRWEKKGKLTAHRSPGGHRLFSEADLKKVHDEKPLSTSEAAAKLGVSTSSLRRFEQEGLIHPQRDARGARMYTAQMLSDYRAARADQQARPQQEKKEHVQKTRKATEIPGRDQYAREQAAAVQRQEQAAHQVPAPPAPLVAEPHSRPLARNKPVHEDKLDLLSAISSGQSAIKKSVKQRTLRPLHARAAVYATLALLAVASVFTYNDSTRLQLPDNLSSALLEGTQRYAPTGGAQALPSGTVLGIAKEDAGRFLEINVPTFIEDELTVTGEFTAPNVVYSIGATNGVIELGEGLAIAGNVLSNTEPGSTQPSLGSISVGTDTLTADLPGDTITVAAGDNITITADTAAKQLTIASDAGIDLDVGTTTPTSGNLLVADGTDFESVAISGDITLTSDGTMTIGDDAVALGTNTDGDYVASVKDAGNGTVTITGSGEGAAVTIDVIDVNCTDCLTATEIADVYLLNTGDSIAGNLTPGSDSTYDLGSSSLRWLNIFTDSLETAALTATGVTEFNAVAYTWPTTGGSSNYVLATDGTGTLTWESVTGVGGLDATGSSANYLAKFSDSDTLTNSVIYETGGSIGINTTTPNSFLLQTAGNIGPNTDSSYTLGSPTLRWEGIYTDSLDAAGNIQPSADSTYDIGSDSLRWANVYADTIDLNFTEGSVLFIDNNGQIAQDNADFFWDHNADRLGIGTTTPGTIVHLGNTDYTWAASGLSFGDGDTGFYEGSDDSLNVYVGGGIKFAFDDSAGLVALPGDGAQIKISGSTSTDPNIIPDRSDSNTGLGSDGSDTLSLITGGVSRLYINSSGNVGIGTTDPLAKLDINGDIRGTSSTLQVASNLAPSSDSSYSLGSSALRWDALYVGSIDTEGNITPTADSTYDLGSESLRWANIYADSLDITNLETDFTQGSVVFTGPGGALAQDNSNFFWDDTNNNLGIGTSTPSRLLHLAADDPQLWIEDTDNSVTLEVLAHSSGGIVGTETNHALIFRTNNSENVRITTSGNVGIGTTDPSSFLLQTAGNIGPNADSSYDLGSTSLRWLNVFTDSLETSALTATGVTEFNTVAYTWPGADGGSGQFLSTNGAGQLSWSTAAGSGTIDGSGTANTIAKFSDSDTLTDSLLTDNGLVIQSGGDFEPTTDSSFELGSSALRWDALYVGSIDAEGNILAAADSTYDIGSDATRWLNIYADSIEATTTAFNGVAYLWPGADGSSGQFLSTNGAGTLSWATAAGSGTIDGSGSANTIAKFSDSDTLTDSLLTDDGLIVQSGGDFEPTTDSTFELGSSALRWDALYVGSIDAEGNITASADSTYNLGSDSLRWLNLFADSLDATSLSAATSSGLSIKDEQDTTAIFVESGGNVGIGTTSPARPLHIVEGSNSVTFDPDSANHAVAQITTANSLRNAGWNFAGTASTWGIANEYNTDGLVFAPATVGNTNFINSAVLTLDIDGTVGIGTTDPSSFKLQTAGNIGPNTDSSYTLGSPTLRWEGIYTDSLDAAGNIQPSADSTYDLGTSSLAWANVYSDSLFASELDTGGLVFAGSSGQLDTDQANLYWDDTNNRLGIGTTTPGSQVVIQSATTGTLVVRGPGGQSTDAIVRLAENSDVVGGYIRYDGSANALHLGTNAASDDDRISILRSSGNVGIGTTSPAGLLAVGASSPFTVDHNGSVIAHNITPQTDSSYSLGSSALRWDALYVGSIDAEGNITPTADSTYNLGSDSLRWLNLFADSVETTTLVSGHHTPLADSTYDLGSETLRWRNIYADSLDITSLESDFTEGSVVFAGPGGALTEDNSNFFWDDTNNRLGLGTTGPGYLLDVNGTAHLRGSSGGTGLFVDSSNRVGIGVGSATVDLDVDDGIRVRRGNAVFNDNGGDNDFRVESDANTHALFVQGSDGNIGIGVTDPSSFKLQVAGGIGPATDSTYELGTSALRWDALYVGSINAEGNITPTATGNYDLGTSALHWNSLYVDSITAYGAILPGSDSAYNLGSDTLRWLNVFADSIETSTLVSGTHTPLADSTYDLGSESLRWANIYADSLDITNLETDFTEGSVVFTGPGGTLAEDNSNFFWDDSNNRLGIGTTSPSNSLHVNGGMYMDGSATITMRVDGSNGDFFYSGGDWHFRTLSGGDDVLITGTGVHPATDSGFDLGSDTVRWLNVFADSIETSTLVTSGNITPTADSTYDIGSDSLRWANVYADTIDLNFTEGSVLFIDNDGQIAQDNADFFWNPNSNRLGIGTTSPDANLHILGRQSAEGLLHLADSGGRNFYVTSNRNGGLIPTNEAFVGIADGSWTWLRSDLNTASSGIQIIGGSTGDIRFKLGSSEIVRFEDSGNVGIGTTTPNTFDLEIAGSIGPTTDSAYSLGSPSLRWEGIYTDSLDAAGNIQPSADSTYDLGTSSLAWANVYSDSLFASGLPQGSVVFAGASGELDADSASLYWDDSNNRLGIGTTAPSSALEISASGADIPRLTIDYSDQSAGDYAGLTFTNGGSFRGGLFVDQSTDYIGISDSTTLRFTVAQGGNVGIGTTGPSSLLDLTSTVPAIRFTDTSTGGTSDDWQLTVNANSMTFQGLGTPGTVMTLDSSGNVGIGTTAPGTLLQTAGTISPSATGNYDLGTSALRWNSLYVDSITAYGNILPGTDSTYDLGSTSLRWLNVFTDSLETAALTATGVTEFNSVAYTWPGADGSSGQLLSTNGAGTLSWTAAGTGTIDGSGTANTIAKFSDSDTLTDSLLTDDGLVVQSGGDFEPTTDSSFELGSSALRWDALYVGSINAEGNISPAADSTYDLGTSSLAWANVYADTLFASGIPQGSVVFAGASGELDADSANLFWDDANNNLGIGVNNPSAKLEVNGNIKLNGNRTINTTNDSDSLTINAGNALNIGVAGIDSMLIGRSDANVPLTLRSNGTTMRLIDNRVGIGTTTPQSTLQVAGNIYPDSDLSYSLGSPTLKWESLYVGSIDAEGNITPADDSSYNLGSEALRWLNVFTDSVESATIASGNIIPTADSTFDLGTTNLDWRNLFVDTIDLDFTEGSVLFIDNDGQITQDNANFFYNNDVNRLGLGTTTPSALLDVNGIVEIGDGSEAAPSLTFGNDTDSGLFSVTGDSVALVAGAVEFITATESTQDILIVNDDGDDIDFLVEASGVTDAFFVEGSTGNVGISDNSPSQLLDIDGTNPQILTEESTTEFLRIGVGENAGEAIVGWDDSDELVFGVYASPTDTTISEFVRIDSSGNVGIGENNPTSTLHVVSTGSLAIPIGTGPTIDGSGEIAIDTTADQFLFHDGSVTRVLSPIQHKSVTIESPADADNFNLFRAPASEDITITDIECIVDPADSSESVVIDIQERNSTGDSPASVDTTITCDNDGASDDGTLSNGSIDADDWVSIDIGTVTGTVTQLTVTVRYTTDRE